MKTKVDIYNILFYIYFYHLQSHNKKGQPLILPPLVEPCCKLLT